MSAHPPPPAATTNRSAARPLAGSHRRHGRPDGGAPQPKWRRPGDWKVRTKLSAVLIVPAVAFLVIAGVQTISSVRAAGTLDQFSDQVRMANEVTALIHAVQRERDRTAGELSKASNTADGPVALDTTVMNEQKLVDDAYDALVRAAAPVFRDQSLKIAYDAVAADFAELARVRSGIRSRAVRQQAMFDAYTRTVADLFQLLPSPSAVSGDRTMARSVQSLADLALVKELTAQLRGKVFAWATQGTMILEEYEIFADLRAQQRTALGRFRTGATFPQNALYDEAVRGSSVRTAIQLLDDAVRQSRSLRIEIAPDQWWPSISAQLDLMRQVESTMLDQIRTAADQRSAAQWQATLLATGVILLILVTALLASWAIGRSMVRSLRALRLGALDVAQHRLPAALMQLSTTARGDPVFDEPVPAVESEDEIGEVAEAFTAVHRAAVRLAVEQAAMRRNVDAMFVNLARRSQLLVERQLQLLDELESSETDPEQLGNLFKLDHLATRMRRNDENLLVLAGADTSRRWAEPVSLTAVALAAMAEIEHYDRVRHDITGGVYVVGHAVADLVRLLAELLENATMFSPPDSTVRMLARASADASSATIVIEDRGLGMSDAGLAEANARLSTRTSIDVASSERMGLVVVGHLAARHDVGVRLTGGSGGVTAYVTLREHLLAPAPVRPYAPLSTGGGRLSGVVRRPVAQVATDTARDVTRDLAEIVGAVRPPVRPVLAGTPLPLPPGPVPVSGPPMPRPVSGIPVSGIPVSGIPVSGMPASGPPADNGSTSAGLPRRPLRQPEPADAEAPGRTLPTRAEDVLNAAAQGSSPSGTRWWSRGPSPGGSGGSRNLAPAAARAERPAPTAGTSTAGLPIRVPMAQLPDNRAATEPAPAADLDPQEVSSVLTRFYSGVHRAADDGPADDERQGSRG